MAGQDGGQLKGRNTPQWARGGDAPGKSSIWLARFLSWEMITAGTPRFRYAHEEWRVDADGVAAKVVDGRAGGAGINAWHALNPAEMFARPFRTGVQPDGVNDAAAGYPTEFRLQPIGGGLTTDTQASGACGNLVLVWLMLTFDFEGRSRPMVLNMLGSHDGTCP